MVIIQVAQLILALTILVFIHELGHFLAARMFGVRVDKFFIFFDAWGKKIWSVKRGDTEYGIGWLPLGGYVKIAGMVDESMDKEQMKKPPESWELRSKPNWQKFIVMIAGIVMNVILGIILYILIHNVYTKSFITVDGVNNEGGIYATTTGQKYGFETGDKVISINEKEFDRYSDYASARLYFGSEVMVERAGQQVKVFVPDSAFRDKMRNQSLFDIKSSVKVKGFVDTIPNAKNAGIQEGDIIKSIDGKELLCYSELTDIMQQNKNNTLAFGIERNGALLEYSVPVNNEGRIGFVPVVKLHEYDSVKYTLGKSISYGTRDAFEVFYFQAIGLWRIIKGDIPAKDSISSPIGITSLFAPKWDWNSFWVLTALLSMVLAFMNLLPIPALDGGHIMFIGIESITRRKLSDKFMERAQVVGMVLLLALMVFAVGNDLFKIFS
ncbi:MAG: RIP metalloprotease RseP [Fimbriimonadaceae bacterium]|nr:RIP metalloprotease RseP [Chitinophagales bacterium]